MKKQAQKKKKKRIRKKIQSKSRPHVVSESNSESTGEKKEKGIVQAVSKKAHEKRARDKAFIVRYVSVAIRFLREAHMELKKVKWPTRKELLASTSMVIFLVLAMAFFLGLIDFGLIKMIKYILD